MGAVKKDKKRGGRRMKSLNRLIKVVKELKEFCGDSFNIYVSISFDHKHRKLWKKFVKKYNVEVRDNSMDVTLPYIASHGIVTIDGIKIYVESSWGDNPYYDAEKAHEYHIQQEIPEVLACAVRSGAIDVDINKVIDNNRCVHYNPEDMKHALLEFKRRKREEE